MEILLCIFIIVRFFFIFFSYSYLKFKVGRFSLVGLLISRLRLPLAALLASPAIANLRPPRGIQGGAGVARGERCHQIARTGRV